MNSWREFETWLWDKVLRNDSALTLHLDIQNDTTATLCIEREHNGHGAKDVLEIRKDTTGGGHPYIRSSAKVSRCCELAPHGDVSDQIFNSGTWIREGAPRVCNDNLACVVSTPGAIRPTISLSTALNPKQHNAHATVMKHVAAGLTSIFEQNTHFQQGVGFYQHGQALQVPSIAIIWESARVTQWLPTLEYSQLEKRFWSAAERLNDVASSVRWIAEFLHSTSIFFANAGGQISDDRLRKRLRLFSRLLEVLAVVGTDAPLIIAALGHKRFKMSTFGRINDEEWPTLKNSLASSLHDLITTVACHVEETKALDIVVQTLGPASYCEATHPQIRDHSAVRACLCKEHTLLEVPQDKPPPTESDSNGHVPLPDHSPNEMSSRELPFRELALRKLLRQVNRDESKPLEIIIDKKYSDQLTTAIKASIEKCSAERDQAAAEEEDAEGEEVEVAEDLFGSTLPKDFDSGNRQYDPVRDDRADHVAVSPIPQSRDTWSAIPSNGWLNPAAPPFGSFHEGDGGGIIYSAAASESGAALDGRGAENSSPPPTDSSLGTSGLSVLADAASQTCPPYADSGYGSSQPTVSSSAFPAQQRDQVGTHVEPGSPHNPQLQSTRGSGAPLPSEATLHRQPSNPMGSPNLFCHSSLQDAAISVGAPTVNQERTLAVTKRTRLPDSDSVGGKRQKPNTTDLTEGHPNINDPASTNAGYEQSPDEVEDSQSQSANAVCTSPDLEDMQSWFCYYLEEQERFVDASSVNL
ncbi:hypothetical protein PWT90_09527 [Aphanocladium album]|nr:hypothetical protein PWT90_09527 [Aphanocladium album]